MPCTAAAAPRVLPGIATPDRVPCTAAEAPRVRPRHRDARSRTVHGRWSSAGTAPSSRRPIACRARPLRFRGYGPAVVPGSSGCAA